MGHDLSDELREMIRAEFAEPERAEVERLLLEITLDHVMARSPWNLDNARGAVIYLSQGRVDKVADYAECARTDFRDVIYWVSLDKKEKAEAKTRAKKKT